MRGVTILGVVLILLGVLALAYQGFWYTKREKVINTGPIHVSAEQKRRFDVPPIVGGAFIVGGVLFVIAGMRRAP